MGYYANRLKKRLESMTDEEFEKKMQEMEESSNIGPEASEFIKEQENYIKLYEKINQSPKYQEVHKSHTLGDDYCPQSAIDYGMRCYERGFADGKEWQKKQDELTWEDIQAIDGITDAVSNSAFERETNEELFTEVLNRFKEHKKYKENKKRKEERNGQGT